MNIHLRNVALTKLKKLDVTEMNNNCVKPFFLFVAKAEYDLLS